MFPNDSPWGDYPAHGTIWSTPFAIAEREARHAAFTAELDMPPVAIRREYTLIDAPARGLKVDTEITARRATGPFLWSSHPMLAVEPGWVVSLGASAATSEETSAAEALSVEVDALMHGRFSGWAAEHVRVDGLSVPEPGLGWGEVIYVGGSDSATVHSSDGRTGTRVTWDRAFFRDLWVVTVSGFEGFDLGFLFEPSTTRPFRLEEAIARGQSRTLEQDERLSFWATVESVDSD